MRYETYDFVDGYNLYHISIEEINMIVILLTVMYCMLTIHCYP